MRLALLLAAAWLWMAGPASACRQALALGLDVSGSVDATEYRLQLDGLAMALEDPDVRDALFSPAGGPVRLAVYEWSGPRDQRLLVGWTDVTPETLPAITAILRTTRRSEADPSTALGASMALGHQLLAEQRDCLQLTLDISGDGKSNTGPRPQSMDLTAPAITVNALVIGSDDPHFADTRQVQVGELSSYFQAYVLRGPDAFVETALGFEDYPRAMRRKLLRELAVMVIGAAPGSPSRADPIRQ